MPVIWCLKSFIMPLFSNISLFLTIILSIAGNSEVLHPSNVVIVILSQQEGYHIAHAKLLEKNILDQSNDLEKDNPEIILSHEIPVNGSWTITPLLPYLSDNYPKAKWFFFCLENTVIRLDKLLTLLSKYTKKDAWIGHALYDHEPTIIHHFADHAKKFQYPHIASGFAMTSHLLRILAERIERGEGPENDFSIDVSYEFTTFVYNNGKGSKLINVPQMCVISGADCATYPRFFHPCSSFVSPDSVYFAVKTCSKYHVERVNVIKKTWAKHVAHIGYYSDKSDKNLPEAYIVPNTTEGHCAKTYAVLEEVIRISKGKEIKWLVVSDDDTIFSVARLLNLLTCYNPANPVGIGERYGFRVSHDFNGYDYLTGGAGLALSMPLVRRIVESGKCECPSPTTPDDMFLFGICLTRIGVQPTHSPMFHQARPTDYATALLASQDPISFHKFWMIDPINVYEHWFAEADDALHQNGRHTEL